MCVEGDCSGVDKPTAALSSAKQEDTGKSALLKFESVEAEKKRCPSVGVSGGVTVVDNGKSAI